MINEARGNYTTDNYLHGTPQAPKELGVLQRVEGLRGGLSELQGRLEAFHSRIGGTPPATMPGGGSAAPSSLGAQLSVIEEHLRVCMRMLEEINGVF